MKRIVVCFCICIFFVLWTGTLFGIVSLPSFNKSALASGDNSESYRPQDTLHLRWKNMGAGFTYQFQMAKDREFQNIVIDRQCKSSEISFPQPASSGTFYVRIRPIGPDGQAGSFSPAQRYDISTLLASPRILTPEEIAEYRDIYDIRATWTSVPHQAGYHVLLARDRMFKHIIYDNPGVTTTDLTFWNLDYGTYFLKISAVSQDGTDGPFSDTVSFIVVPPVPMTTAAD